MPAENQLISAIEAADPNKISTSTPQCNLRFVEREIGDRKVRILQQLWAISLYDTSVGMFAPIATATEWRDVPLVMED